MLVQGKYYACERCVVAGDPRALATCEHATATLRDDTKIVEEGTRRGLEAPHTFPAAMLAQHPGLATLNLSEWPRGDSGVNDDSNEGNRFHPIADGKKCEKGHVHVWPTSGRHELVIEPCETQCGWCDDYTTNTVSNLRKVSINP
jgi:hypothetical protein